MSRLSTSDPRCPLCRRPAVAAQMPFCSPLCRDRDLLNWLDERYVAPGPAADEEDGRAVLDNDRPLA